MADEDMGEERPLVTRAEAKAGGKTRYWTGKPCKHGHIAERIVENAGCVACRWDIEKRYRENNPETFAANRLETERRYRAKYPEKLKEKSRLEAKSASPERRARQRVARAKWAKAHPEEVAARTKRWGLANIDKRREHGRRWRANNLEVKQKMVREWREKNRHKPEYREKALKRADAWALANPEKARLNGQQAARRRRARKAEVPAEKYTVKQTLDLLEAQNHECAACRAPLTKKTRELDHIMPIARLGPDELSNLQWLCKPCNRSKGAKHPDVWAVERGKLLLTCPAG